MTDPVIPQLTPGDKDKMVLLNSASQPVLGLFFKPFIFEPGKLNIGETGVVFSGDGNHPYGYKPIRPLVETNAFRHRLSSYVISGFDLSEVNNKLVIAPGKMNVFLTKGDTVANSYIEVDYSGATIDVLPLAAVPYNHPTPVVAQIVTNGHSSLSLTVKIGASHIDAYDLNREYVTLGTIFSSPTGVISILNGGTPWSPTSQRIEDIILAVSPMQHNIIPKIDGKKFGVKVELGDHASLYDRSVTPKDINYKHSHWKPASQVRFTVIDSNGGYINQSISSPTECVNAGKLQDKLRNGSPSGMTTDQFCLHPLFYSAETDKHGNPAEGVLYMQLAQTVYNKPLGSQGIFFVEEYMLEESLGNFIRADVIKDTAAFIGFFVCGEAVGSISDCEVIAASDGFSRSLDDPSPTLPSDPIDGKYVTYHDGGYHADGVPAADNGTFFLQEKGGLTPLFDFGSTYSQFKIRVIYGDPRVPTAYEKMDDFWHVELYNAKHPNGVSSKVSGSDAAYLKTVLWFTGGVTYADLVPLLGKVQVDNSAVNMFHPFQRVPILSQKALGLDKFGIRINPTRSIDLQDAVNLMWGVSTGQQSTMMPVFYNFNIKVDTLSTTNNMNIGVPEDSVISYNFLRDKSMLTSNKFWVDASKQEDNLGRFYINRTGENAGNFGMLPFCTQNALNTKMGNYTANESLNDCNRGTLTDIAQAGNPILPFTTEFGAQRVIRVNDNAQSWVSDPSNSLHWMDPLKRTIPTRANRNLFTERTLSSDKYLACMNQAQLQPNLKPEELKHVSGNFVTRTFSNSQSRPIDKLFVIHCLLTQASGGSTLRLRVNGDPDLFPGRKFVYEFEAGGYIPT